KVWIAEQKHDAEEKKLAELRKNIEEERQLQELRQLQAANGNKSAALERVDWLYEGPMAQSGNTAEEYLLGKEYKPDSASSDLKQLGTTKYGSLALTKSALPANDAFSRLNEDPMMLIRKRQQAVHESVLKNPVKMGKIKASVDKILSEKKAKKKAKKEKKKEKKRARGEKKRKRDRSIASDESSGGDDENDKLQAASEGDEMRSEEEIARVRAPAAIMRSAHVVAAPVTIVREEAEAETAGVLQPVVLVVVVTTIARAVAVRAHVWIETKSRVTRASEKAQRETHQNAVVARVPVATRTEAVEMTGAIAERALLQEMTVLVMITALTEAQVVKKRDAAVQSDSHAEDAMMAMMMEIDRKKPADGHKYGLISRDGAVECKDIDTTTLGPNSKFLEIAREKRRKEDDERKQKLSKSSGSGGAAQYSEEEKRRMAAQMLEDARQREEYIVKRATQKSKELDDEELKANKNPHFLKEMHDAAYMGEGGEMGDRLRRNKHYIQRHADASNFMAK
ncbi:hypothetical protein Gpo141_00013802, partial [Globisporangium polare]